jgi:DNA polymerase-4
MAMFFNTTKPLVMHIDLNSCFATAAQQANPLLRGKPVVVAAYNSQNGCILSPSIESKKYGIKTGMRIKDARMLCPSIIVRTPDTTMIRDIHSKFKKIFSDYTPHVVPKSIDEAILEFDDVDYYGNLDLFAIGKEIKKRMREEIGEYISCSVGISTNRFLAKTAASLKKPDGLEMITHHNIYEVFARLTLLDIYGINVRNQLRLNTYGIYTPLEFLESPVHVLRKQVFKSICGYYWYMRMRGFEVDRYETHRKTYGQQYALKHPTKDNEELRRIVMKLCEKMGRRLRRANMVAYGIHISLIYDEYNHWNKGHTTKYSLYTTSELYKNALEVLKQGPHDSIIRKISVTCFNIKKKEMAQPGLFDSTSFENKEKLWNVWQAMDQVNDRYGEYVVTTARMAHMKKTIIDMIAFGNVSEIDDSASL